MRDRGVSSGLAGVSGVCSRVPLVDEASSEARRYWEPALVSIAAGMRLVFGEAGVDCDCEDCRAEVKDWRLLVRAMRDCLGQRAVKTCMRRQMDQLTRTLSDRAAASRAAFLEALSSAMLRKRSSAWPPSAPGVRALAA